MFKVRDKVRITCGPFKDYSGKIVNIGTDGLVQVRLDLICGGLVATFLASELAIYVKSINDKFV